METASLPSSGDTPKSRFFKALPAPPPLEQPSFARRGSSLSSLSKHPQQSSPKHHERSLPPLPPKPSGHGRGVVGNGTADPPQVSPVTSISSIISSYSDQSSLTGTLATDASSLSKDGQDRDPPLLEATASRGGQTPPVLPGVRPGSSLMDVLNDATSTGALTQLWRRRSSKSDKGSKVAQPTSAAVAGDTAATTATLTIEDVTSEPATNAASKMPIWRRTSSKSEKSEKSSKAAKPTPAAVAVETTTKQVASDAALDAPKMQLWRRSPSKSEKSEKGEMSSALVQPTSTALAGETTTTTTKQFTSEPEVMPEAVSEKHQSPNPETAQIAKNHKTSNHNMVTLGGLRTLVSLPGRNGRSTTTTSMKAVPKPKDSNKKGQKPASGQSGLKSKLRWLKGRDNGDNDRNKETENDADNDDDDDEGGEDDDHDSVDMDGTDASRATAHQDVKKEVSSGGVAAGLRNLGNLGNGPSSPIKRLPTPEYGQDEVQGSGLSIFQSAKSPVSPASSPEPPVAASLPEVPYPQVSSGVKKQIVQRKPLGSAPKVSLPALPMTAAPSPWPVPERDTASATVATKQDASDVLVTPSTPSNSATSVTPAIFTTPSFPVRTSSRTANTPSPKQSAHARHEHLKAISETSSLASDETVKATDDVQVKPRAPTCSEPSTAGKQADHVTSQGMPPPSAAGEEEKSATTTTDNAGAARFPRNWYQAAFAHVPDAVPLKESHFSCPTRHRVMFASSQRYNPIACATCAKKDCTYDFWSCGHCYVRICPSCRNDLQRRFRGNLRAMAQELQH